MPESPADRPPPAAPAEPGARRDRWIAAALGAAALALYAATRQPAYWSDGRLILSWVEGGRWFHYHVLYLPLAHAAHALGRPLLGADPEPALAWLSALCGAAAVALVFLAGRAARAPLGSALGAALCFALAPAVWFYATTIEVHTPNLLAAAGLVLWLAHAGARAEACAASRTPAALAAGLFGALVAGTHLSGVLWGPALFVAGTRGARWNRASLLAVASAALLGLIVGVALASDVARELLLRAAFGITAWSPAGAWRELIAPAAGLWFGLAWLARSDRNAATGPFGSGGAGLVLLAVLPFALVVPGLPYDERGAYALVLFPLLAVLLARALPVRMGLALGLLLALAGGTLGWRERQAWVHAYPGVEWIEPMIRASGNRGVVLAADDGVRQMIARHSRLDVVGLEQMRERSPDPDAALVNGALAFFDAFLPTGRFAAVTAELAVTDFGRELLRRLEARGARILAAAGGGYVEIRAPEAAPSGNG